MPADATTGGRRETAANHHGFPRVLLGDWNPIIRDPIDVLRASYIVGAVVFALMGNVGGAARLLVTAVAVLIARWIAVPRPFDLAFVLGMALQGWGNAFNLFDRLNWWDDLVHPVLTLCVAPLFYIGLARLKVVPDLAEETQRHHYVGVFLITLSLGLAFGAVYEIYEWTVDHWFGAHLAIGYTDTITDLSTDAAGSAVGGALLVLWAVRGWGTSRRVPASRIPA